jgi:glycerophosphoryl diester phosphodiesterase
MSIKIYAHRGYSGVYPENTMASFTAASEVGCYGIELDVQLSKDGEVVIIHDETVNRTTNKKGFVRDYTLLELQSFNASKLHEKMAPDEYIPTFKQYCAFVKNKKLITNVELKTGVYYYEGLEEKTLEIIKKFGLEDRILFSSFNPLSLVKIQQLMPQILGIKVGEKNTIPCALLSESPLDNAGALCRQNGYVAFHPGINQLNKKNIIERVNNCHKNGIAVNVWTVNNNSEFQRLKKAGVDGIFTNFCEKYCNL